MARPGILPDPTPTVKDRIGHRPRDVICRLGIRQTLVDIVATGRHGFDMSRVGHGAPGSRRRSHQVPFLAQPELSCRPGRGHDACRGLPGDRLESGASGQSGPGTWYVPCPGHRCVADLSSVSRIRRTRRSAHVLIAPANGTGSVPHLLRIRLGSRSGAGDANPRPRSRRPMPPVTRASLGGPPSGRHRPRLDAPGVGNAAPRSTLSVASQRSRGVMSRDSSPPLVAQ